VRRAPGGNGEELLRTDQIQDGHPREDQHADVAGCRWGGSCGLCCGLWDRRLRDGGEGGCRAKKLAEVAPVHGDSFVYGVMHFPSETIVRVGRSEQVNG
jgi:hypothetical protein